MKKYKSIKIIIGIIALFLIAAVTYHFRPEISVTKDQSTTLTDYTNDTYHFSLKYPANLKVSTFSTPDDTGDVVLIAEKDTPLGMQMTITPFDEDLKVLTVDRIKKDVPDLTILEPQDVTLGSAGRGVAFFDGVATTSNRQVWFVANQYLYQITAPKGFDDRMKSILNSWTFF